MKFIDKFVYKYIKRNLGHTNFGSKRNMILSALTEGMKETFYEDNLVTRYYSLIQWLLQNDKVFQEMTKIEDHKIDVNLAEVLKQAVLDLNKGDK